MNVVIPFHNGDANLAIDLVKWIGQLGGIGEGSLILVVDKSVNQDSFNSILALAKGVSKSVLMGTLENTVSGWPKGSNALFARQLELYHEQAPWLWLEPDAIPLKAGWLDAIRKEYASCGKRYMGNVYVCNNPNLPNRLMSGIGVYPADAKEEMIHFTTTQFAWDVESARFLVENCHHTKLIHHFWGIMGMAPTFAEKRTDTSPPNTFTLDSIHKDAAIFHRNKDGTLLKLLKEKIQMTVPMPEVETLAPIKNDSDLIAEIRKSVDNW